MGDRKHTIFVLYICKNFYCLFPLWLFNKFSHMYKCLDLLLLSKSPQYPKHFKTYMIFGKLKLIIICVYFQYDYLIVIDTYKFSALLVALKVGRITLNYKSITLRHVEDEYALSLRECETQYCSIRI